MGTAWRWSTKSRLGVYSYQGDFPGGTGGSNGVTLCSFEEVLNKLPRPRLSTCQQFKAFNLKTNLDIDQILDLIGGGLASHEFKVQAVKRLNKYCWFRFVSDSELCSSNSGFFP